MKKGLLQVLRFLAFLIVGVLLLWLAFRKTDFSKVTENLKEANYWWVALSVLFGAIAFVSRARRWVLLINPLGYKPSLASAYHAVMTGYLANFALPRLGELSRCVALGKKEKIPVDQLFGTVLIERAFDLIALLTITILVILTASDEIVELLNESIFYPLQEKVVAVFGVTWVLWVGLLAGALISLYLVYRFRSSLRRFKIMGKMFDVAKGIINGLKSVTNLERKGEFIFHTALIWLCYAMMTWVVVFAIDSTSGVSLAEGIFLLVVGGLAMSAPVQGGLGVFHYVISRAVVTLENVSLEDGLAYAVLTHESQLIWVILAGTISFYLLLRKSSETV